MLDIKKFRENLNYIKKSLAQRGINVDVDCIVEKDHYQRELQRQAEDLKRRRNISSDNIANMKQRGESADKEIKLMKEVSLQIKNLDKKLKDTFEELKHLLLDVPNIPGQKVPIGGSTEDNPVVKKHGEVKIFSFTPKSHLNLGEKLDILDFKRGAKIAGTNFVLLKGLGARLSRALINFMLDIHTNEHGYKEMSPPFIVNKDSMTGTGQLPKFEEDLFRLKDCDFYLIPTAEVPLTNIFKNEIFAENSLPVCFTAYTPCFRREAGSYGKNTSGLIRQHQFDKVELVKFVKPENSYDELESLLNNAEEILKRLDLPYRVVELCTGDLGFSAAKTYDIEVWLPDHGEYKEISSCSNFEDFQARRAKIRYKKSKDAKPDFVHTLNGSGLAVGRLMVAILENFQQEDGSVLLPNALHEYMGGIKEIN